MSDYRHPGDYDAREPPRSEQRFPLPERDRDRPIDESKLYIGNINYKTTEEDLRYEFRRFGEVIEVHIPIDRDHGRPRGFAFVSFNDARDADEALTMDGKEVGGRRIRVTKADKKAPRPAGGPPPSRPPPPNYHQGGYGGRDYDAGPPPTRYSSYGRPSHYNKDEPPYSAPRYPPRREYNSRRPPARNYEDERYGAPASHEENYDHRDYDRPPRRYNEYDLPSRGGPPPRDEYRGPPRGGPRPPRDNYPPPRDNYLPPRDDYPPPREDVQRYEDDRYPSRGDEEARTDGYQAPAPNESVGEAQ